MCSEWRQLIRLEIMVGVQQGKAFDPTNSVKSRDSHTSFRVSSTGADSEGTTAWIYMNTKFTYLPCTSQDLPYLLISFQERIPSKLHLIQRCLIPYSQWVLWMPESFRPDNSAAQKIPCYQKYYSQPHLPQIEWRMWLARSPAILVLVSVRPISPQLTLQSRYGSPWKETEAEKNLLRTHTTAVSSRMLYKLAKDGFRPAKYFSIDRVFRNEAIDRTHLAEFHQIEGVQS